jgi:hypothetical protein
VENEYGFNTDKTCDKAYLAQLRDLIKGLVRCVSKVLQILNPKYNR